MAEPNNADTTKPDNSLVWVKINLPYFRTPAGMVKLLQLCVYRNTYLTITLPLTVSLMTTEIILGSEPAGSQGRLEQVKLVILVHVVKEFPKNKFSKQEMITVFKIIGIICMACASPALLNGTHWFLFVSVLSFIATLIWVFVYLLSIREALTLPINWNLTELFNTGVLTILYLIAFIVQLSIWTPTNYRYRSPNIAAGIFGLFNTIAYGFGTYLLYKEWKTSPPNQ